MTSHELVSEVIAPKLKIYIFKIVWKKDRKYEMQCRDQPEGRDINSSVIVCFAGEAEVWETGREGTRATTSSILVANQQIQQIQQKSQEIIHISF